RVLLAAAQPRIAVAGPGEIRVSDATGRSHVLPPGAYRVGPGLGLPVGHKRVRVRGAHGHRETTALVPVRRPLRSPVVFDCPSAPLAWNGHAYHGLLVVRRAGKRLSLVNSLALEDYVRGVVGGEMPWRWNMAALEAQAV